MPRVTFLATVCAAALLAAACFEAPKPACAFLCGDDGACPDGYSCRPDGWCKRTGSGSDMVADEFVCDDTVPVIDADTTVDGSGIDAAAVDASSIDGGLGLGASCSSAGECESGFCSDDVCCDAACDGACDACSTAEGASADGTCTILGGTVECRAAAGDCDVAETCNGVDATCPTDAFEDSGTPCGDATDDDCTNPDTCDGSGTCLPNHEASGVQCTDTDTTDCNDAQCDGAGTCDQTADVEAADTPCGDGTDDDCTNPDTCDSGGTCLPNHEVVDTPCGDASDTDCTNPDTCDGAGVCLDNHATDKTACTDLGGGEDTCCGGVCVVAGGTCP